MYCTKCGKQINFGDKFCVGCGNNLEQHNVNQGNNQISNIIGDVEKSSKMKDIATVLMFTLGIFVLSLLFMIIYNVMHGIDIFDTESLPASITFLPFLVFLITFSMMYFKTLKKDMNRITKKQLLFVVIMSVVILAANMGMSILLDILNITISNQESAEEAFMQNMLLSGFSMIIAAPIVEELVFRRALNGIVTNTALFLIISSLFFAVMHWSGTATFVYVVSGFLFALVYIKTDKNVVAAIIAHFINNAVSVVVMLFTL